MKRITEGAWLLPFSTANTILLEDGDDLVLFDAGFGNKERVLFEAIAKLGRVWTAPRWQELFEAAAVCRSVRPCVRPSMRLSHVPLAMMAFARNGSRPKVRTRGAPAKEAFPVPAVSTGFVHQLPSALPNIVGVASSDA